MNAFGRLLCLGMCWVVTVLCVDIDVDRLGADQEAQRSGVIAFQRSTAGDPPQFPIASPRFPLNAIYLLYPNGSETRLGASEEGTFPSWSPDGTRVVFAGPERQGISIVNADGSSDFTQVGTDGHSPAWSPDGGKIAFTFVAPGGIDIYLMRTDGSDRQHLTDSPGLDDFAAWSPDGSRIAFVSSRDDDGQGSLELEIYTMAPDGSDQTRLTRTGYNSVPAWSPDASTIAFTSTRDGYAQTYLMNADGSGQRPLVSRHWCAAASATPKPTLPATPVECGGDHEPTWSPDGHWLAFVSYREPGNSDLFAIRNDGSQEARLTHTPDEFEFHPDWQPVRDDPIPSPMVPGSPKLPSPPPASPEETDSCIQPFPVSTTPSPLTFPAPPSLPSAPVVSPSPAGAPASSPLATPLDTVFPNTTPPSIVVNGLTPTPYYPGGPAKDDLPNATRSDPMSWPATPQTLEPELTPSPTPTPDECEQLESGGELTAQAIGLIALGVLAVGSAITLPFAALRRGRSSSA